MTTDQQLPKDPVVAANILAALKAKDEDETICRYPTCHELRQIPTGTGRPSAYCQNTEHTALASRRARQRLQAIADNVALETISKQKPPLPMSIAPVESLRASVVSSITQLQQNMEHYLATLTTMTDPDLSAAQIQAIIDQAECRVAEAQQNASTERSLRLAAEVASIAARQDAQAEREAAEVAIMAMEEAEARTKRIEAERDETVNRMHIEVQRKIEEIETQARQAITTAQAIATSAEEQARQADARAHNAETDARSQIATAEQLVHEARTTLRREQDQVDQLRAELSDARLHAETERVKAHTLLERERAEARSTLEYERSEVHRLQAELAASRTHIEHVTKRADQLATLTDELRAKLVQIQIIEKER